MSAWETIARRFAKAYADLGGYFWLECGRCGRMYGGHEWKSGEEYAVKCSRDPDGSLHHGTCCAAPEPRDDDAVCARVHALRGDP